MLPPDLTPLNLAEREVLALLAQGHTAKSIATLTGRSEGSVNERLREARRKTGVASSRELARLLAQAESPKNRDEQIGVGETPSNPSGSSMNTAPRSRGGRNEGVMIMGVITGAVAPAAMWFAVQQAPRAAAPAEDALIGNRFAIRPAPSLPELHAGLRRESRDERWASGTEAEIRARFIEHAGLGRAGDVLRVTCGRTLCEVAVTMPAGGEKRIAPVMEGIQGKELQGAMDALGLANEIMWFGSPNDKPSQPLLVSYWRRK